MLGKRRNIDIDGVQLTQATLPPTWKPRFWNASLFRIVSSVGSATMVPAASAPSAMGRVGLGKPPWR